MEDGDTKLCNDSDSADKNDNCKIKWTQEEVSVKMILSDIIIYRLGYHYNCIKSVRHWGCDTNKLSVIDISLVSM